MTSCNCLRDIILVLYGDSPADRTHLLLPGIKKNNSCTLDKKKNYPYANRSSGRRSCGKEGSND